MVRWRVLLAKCAVGVYNSLMDAFTNQPIGLCKNAAELGQPMNDVVVLLACNEKFVPYMSVTLQSILENSDPQREYDIIVLTSDISPANMELLHWQASCKPNVRVGFLDAMAAAGNATLPCHGHFACETYYRLLAPELLPGVDKAAYIDCDLVVLDDIAKLYDVDLKGYLLAATLDADTAGMAGGYDEAIYDYLKNDVGLEDPYTYFQAGVLVLNLAEFRRSAPTGKCIALANVRHWQWLDQDVLNYLASGDFVRLDMAWNTLFDWQGLRCGHIIPCAPPEMRGAYAQARRAPKIVHYAGPDNRPWLYPKVDFAEAWWQYARRCPYRKKIAQMLKDSHHNLADLRHRLVVFFAFKVGMPLVNAVFPPNTKRRRWAIRTFRNLDGGKLL